MTSPEDDEEEEEIPIEERLEQIFKEIMECDYYPKDITQADMEDYLTKEKSGENVFASVKNMDYAYDSVKVSEQLFIDEITERINKNFKDYGIQPNIQTQRDINEEISIFRIKQYGSLLKELKADFQVDKFRLVNTFRNKKVLKTYTDDQIKNAVLAMWHTKDCIDKMEKEQRDWEQEAKQRYGSG
jgi:hypothetical protein